MFSDAQSYGKQSYSMWVVWVDGVLGDTLALKPNRGVSSTRPSGPPINKQPMADD